MKYVDEFRDRELALGLAAAIEREADTSRRYNIMEFCGGHTHAIFRYGVQELMPENVNFVHGPGCPVCVLPIGRVDNALELAEQHGVILCSYGDMLRVPASSRRSLLKAKAEGADVRMVYSIEDALNIARQNPGARWCSSPSASRRPRRQPPSPSARPRRKAFRILPFFAIMC